MIPTPTHAKARARVHTPLGEGRVLYVTPERCTVLVHGRHLRFPPDRLAVVTEDPAAVVDLLNRIIKQPGAIPPSIVATTCLHARDLICNGGNHHHD